MRNQPGETEPPTASLPGSNSPRDKSTSAIATAPATANAAAQDAITPQNSTPSKHDNLRVPATRRSTGTSKTSSKPSFQKRFTIRWPRQNNRAPAIHWYTPVMMVLLGLAGLFGALGHHLHNSNLHGQPVKDAQWPQRWGVALAFFVKMTLVGAVQTAVKQRAWVSICLQY